ncbi:unnamed protein product [Blepharisma stoltei]|uniref:Uncharacterized protein n=1 Tax=Blepharisma stoltei TaxID=1481888 RepID=A0AAU9K442_9CILI|nr:unnamed protein product [Blepharisma stoltei]
MKPQKSTASFDLPDYLASKYTLRTNTPQNRRPSKKFLPQLKLGVSEETPKSFHGSFINILNTDTKNSLIAGHEKSPHGFMSDLKKNRLSHNDSFTHQEYSISKQLTSFDLHTLPLSQAADYSQLECPHVRRKCGFSKKWLLVTEDPKGFKRNQGLCSFYANQPQPHRYKFGEVKRLNEKMLSTLKSVNSKKQLFEKVRHRSLRRVESEREKIRSKSTDFMLMRKIHKKSQKNWELLDAQNNEEEIKSFDLKLKNIKDRKRWCYNI